MIWKLYAWILTVLIILAVPAAGYTTNWHFHLVDFLNLFFMILGVIGAFGFAYKRKIATKQLWLVVLVISFVYQFTYSFMLDQKYGAVPATSTIDGLVTFVPLIPMFIALYFYVFRTKWHD
jgi:hypothetical protein